MAEFSGKTESPDEIANRVYVETLEVFSVLEIIRNLAAMHRSAMSGECSDSDRNDLILGDSGITNIVRMIRESVSFTCDDPAQTAEPAPALEIDGFEMHCRDWSFTS